MSKRVIRLVQGRTYILTVLLTSKYHLTFAESCFSIRLRLDRQFNSSVVNHILNIQKDYRCTRVELNFAENTCFKLSFSQYSLERAIWNGTNKSICIAGDRTPLHMHDIPDLLCKPRNRLPQIRLLRSRGLSVIIRK